MAKEWIDHAGNKVPAQYVHQLDKKKDAFAQSSLKNALVLSGKLQVFKKNLLKNADNIYAEMLKDANLTATDRKGNYSITSFDKSIKIEVKMSSKMEFDDNINFAQEKISEFLRVKTENVDFDLTELVNNAFTTTKGRLDTNRILSLFSLKIKHPLWIEAIDLIKKSISTNVSKRYINIWKKNSQGEYDIIMLNFSSIDVE